MSVLGALPDTNPFLGVEVRGLKTNHTGVATSKNWMGGRACLLQHSDTPYIEYVNFAISRTLRKP